MASSANSQPFSRIAQETREQVINAKERALDERQFESFYQAATRIDDPYFRLQCQFSALALGRLGLRAGELVHFDERWVDQREKFVTIPPRQPCFGGRDGGLCSMCEKNAQQMADHNDGLSLDAAREMFWKPKTGAGARAVYYGFSPRIEMIVERFVDEWEQWPVSYQSLLRRVKRVAEAADGVDAEELSPHPLRASAATHLAGKGMELSGLMQFFGWSDSAVPTIYINRSSKSTASQLSAIHNR